MNKSNYTTHVIVQASQFYGIPIHVPSFINSWIDRQPSTNIFDAAIVETKIKLKEAGVGRIPIKTFGYCPFYIGLRFNRHDKTDFGSVYFYFMVVITGTSNMISKMTKYAQNQSLLITD